MAEDVIARYVLDLNTLKGQVKELTKQFGIAEDAAKDSGQKAGKLFSDGFSVAGATLKNIGLGIAAAFSIKEVIAFGKESVRAFEEAQKSATQLKAALSANGGIQADFDKLIKQSAELQKTTIFSDEEIQGAQRAAAQYGLTADAIESLIPLIADFASATGQDLNAALEAVIQGLNGQGRGLKQYGIEIDTTATKSARFASIQDQLTKKFEGQAKVLGETAQGSIKRLGNAFDDLKESVGEAILPIVEAAAQLAKSFVDIASTPLSEKLQDEQKEFGATRIQLLGLNEGSQERVKIIQELQAKYPDYLANINAEKVSNDELFKALDKINNSLIFRIAVQRTQESLDKQAEATAKSLNDQAEARGNLLKALDSVLGSNNSAQKKYNENLIKGLPFELAIKEILNNKIKLNGVASVSLSNLGDAYDAYEKAVVNASGEQVKFNDLQLEVKKRQEDIRQLIGAPIDAPKRTGLESLLDGINLATVSMKKLIELRKQLEGKTDETSKQQLEQVVKEIEARNKLLDKAAQDRLDQLKKEADLRESLRKKELAQDLENIEVQLAQDKQRINESTLSEFGKSVAIATIEKKALEDRALAYTQYGESVGAVLNQIVDKTTELNKIVAKGPGEIHPNAEDFKIQSDAVKEADDEILKQKEANDKAIRESAIQSAQELVSTVNELYQQAANEQIAQIERVKEAELKALDDQLSANQRNFDDRKIGAREFRQTEDRLLKQKQAAEETARKKEIEIKRKQDIANRAQKLFDITIATARAIAEVSPNPYLIALAAVLGAAQTAVVLGTPLPQYAKGTKYVDKESRFAPGIDTVPAMLTRGERVITAKDNKEHWELFEAVSNKRLNDYVLKKYVTPALLKAQSTAKITDQRTFAENVAYSLSLNEKSLASEIAAAINKDNEWRTRRGQKVIGMEQLIETIRSTNKPQYRRN